MPGHRRHMCKSQVTWSMERRTPRDSSWSKPFMKANSGSRQRSRPYTTGTRRPTRPPAARSIVLTSFCSEVAEDRTKYALGLAMTSTRPTSMKTTVRLRRSSSGTRQPTSLASASAGRHTIGVSAYGARTTDPPLGYGTVPLPRLGSACRLSQPALPRLSDWRPCTVLPGATTGPAGHLHRGGDVDAPRDQVGLQGESSSQTRFLAGGPRRCVQAVGHGCRPYGRAAGLQAGPPLPARVHGHWMDDSPHQAGHQQRKERIPTGVCRRGRAGHCPSNAAAPTVRLGRPKEPQGCPTATTPSQAQWRSSTVPSGTR